ncbi:MAG: sigma-54-dependent Fis family transcriptional regulator [Deltaproteobacteria bacterium]|nr:MAG: sigma-54-dependent Fis family transcriptional regulator [Deltaproteobacteria bacterium]
MEKHLVSKRSSWNAEYPVIVGESDAIKSVREKIEKVSDKNVTVLIRGGSGTGKELVARAIHLRSKRKEQSFVTVNCAAIPSELLESELFGFTKGAFTGATHDKPGKFETADRGTIFLDEIGSLSLPLQAKILQVLEDQKLSRLGSVNEKPINVRIIAATNSNLEEKIINNDFRTDLYYRLNVISIVVPPLRERKEDIFLLTDYFMDKYCSELKKDRVHIDDSVKEHFQRYHWPGNVRELENIIKGIIALQKTDMIYTDLKLKEVTDTEEELPSSKSSDLYQVWDNGKIEQLIEDKRNLCLKTIRGQYIAEVEKRAICKALELTRWNRKNAAELLQVSYKTLLNRIEEFKLMK